MDGDTHTHTNIVTDGQTTGKDNASSHLGGGIINLTRLSVFYLTSSFR